MDPVFRSRVRDDAVALAGREFGHTVKYQPKHGAAALIQAVHSDQGSEERDYDDGLQVIMRADLWIKRHTENGIPNPRVGDSWFYDGRQYYVVGFGAIDGETATLNGVHTIQTSHIQQDMRRSRR